jgi:tetratricopeptide (TPR) repeat protein
VNPLIIAEAGHRKAPLTDKGSEPSGTLATALAHAARLLATNPSLAEAQSREILKAVPGHPQALLLLGAALRDKGDAESAREVLEPLASAQPKSADVQFELGLTLAHLGESKAAIKALSRAVKLNPKLPRPWLALGDQLTLAGDSKGADDAYAQHIRASASDPQLIEAATALCDNKLAVAERLLREFLKIHPTDVAAIRMLAEVAARLRRYEDAAKLLERCLELAPSFTAARQNYATILYRSDRASEAIAEVDRLLQEDPRNQAYRNLKAAALARIGEYARSAEIYASVLKDDPSRPKVWMSYGHTLRTMGRQDECITAYWKSIKLMPSLGEAYWSLANLKTFRFTPAQVAEMRAQLARTDLEDEDRFHLHFALGKALEDEQHYAESFEHYRQGNALRRKGIEYDAAEATNYVQRSKALFTPEFFLARAHMGCEAPDPIFVVGLPRAGSTLIEQILASHSQIEGTMELPEITSIAGRLSGRKKKSDESAFPEILGTLEAKDFKNLGEEYLEHTRIHRKLGRKFFIDKTPQNFSRIGLIHLILPNAKIIDAQRHPLACGLSCFKQHFARGHNFSYDLTELGGYYANYVELMAHFDAVLPGRIHRVIYENMIADLEGEVRRLLAYCGLPFEEQCLRFYETERAVRTASSEQVRRPIFTEAVDHWRNYEPWLEPLKQALGPVLNAYPGVPDFLAGNG